MHISREEAEATLKELAINKIREKISKNFTVDPRMLAEFLHEELGAKITISNLKK